MPGADRDLPALLQRFPPLGGEGGANRTIARPTDVPRNSRREVMWSAPEHDAPDAHHEVEQSVGLLLLKLQSTTTLDRSAGKMMLNEL